MVIYNLKEDLRQGDSIPFQSTAVVHHANTCVQIWQIITQKINSEIIF